jgi:hydrogenase expression/formation protein HypC
MCLAVPGKIIAITNQDPIMRTGKVSFGGIVKEVNLAYVPKAQPGDYVIVHAGFAINALNEQDALRVYESLDELEFDDPDDELS